MSCFMWSDQAWDLPLLYPLGSFSRGTKVLLPSYVTVHSSLFDPECCLPPQCCFEKGLGRLEPGGVLISHVLKLDSQPHVLWTMSTPPKSWSGSPCRDFPCMQPSGQCLLFPIGWSSTFILITPLPHGSQSSVCCTASEKMAALFYVPRFLP